MKWIGLFLLVFVTSAAHSLPLHSLNLPKEDSSENLHKAYVYGPSEMNRANWIYLGYLPRATDPSRISINLSKMGHTMRITLEMTEQEVAAYPQYLVQKAQRYSSIMQQRALALAQPTLGQNYFNQIAQVQQRSQYNYKNGLAWLKKFFPQNIFEVSGQGAIKVIAHFVFPITTLSYGPHLPADGTYYTNYLDERRDNHTDLITGKKDFIFGGFPAFWFTGQIGIHGPIRFSKASEVNPSTGQTMPNFWRDNEFGNFGYDKMADLNNPKYRWDLVRTKNSQGCIRAESMTVRHLLPANTHQAKSVPIHVQTQFDQIVVPGQSTAKYVNVAYYVVHPYQKPLTQDQWLQREAPNMLSQKSNLMTFPYLDPASVEFYNASGTADPNGMAQLNQAE